MLKNVELIHGMENITCAHFRQRAMCKDGCGGHLFANTDGA